MRFRVRILVRAFVYVCLSQTFVPVLWIFSMWYLSIYLYVLIYIPRRLYHFTLLISLGGMNMGVFEGCMVAEELAYGCTGIMTAMEASGLGVSEAIAVL